METEAVMELKKVCIVCGELSGSVGKILSFVADYFFFFLPHLVGGVCGKLQEN